MTKFKIGDRVRKVDNEFLWRFKRGDELVVVGISCMGNAMVAEMGGTEDWDTAYDSDLELIQPFETEAITLTRYIKPATIEINGVEYLMPEKNNAS